MIPIFACKVHKQLFENAKEPIFFVEEYTANAINKVELKSHIHIFTVYLQHIVAYSCYMNTLRYKKTSIYQRTMVTIK